MHARYYSGIRSAGLVERLGLLPVQVQDAERVGFLAAPGPLTAPVQQVEYLTAGTPAVDWLSQYWQTGSVPSGGQTDATRTFSAGEDTHDDWNAYPLHTALNENLLGAGNVNLLGTGLEYGNEAIIPNAPRSRPGWLRGDRSCWIGRDLSPVNGLDQSLAG